MVYVETGERGGNILLVLSNGFSHEKVGWGMEKNWIVLDGNKEAEYSTDLDFFIANQIMVVTTGINHVFCSRLESRKFNELKMYSYDGKLSKDEKAIHCRIIHMNLLKGKLGKTAFVN